LGFKVGVLTNQRFYKTPQLQFMTLKALIFDVDGTLADTEAAHLAAFNESFQSMGIPWMWDVPTYKGLLMVSGGKERMRHYWASSDENAAAIASESLSATIETLHRLKTAAYERLVAEGFVTMRPGILPLIEEAIAAGLALGIATTTSAANVSALLSKAIGPEWRAQFQAVEDASTAPSKKPHPQAYQQVLQRLMVEGRDCMAFEDSENGLRAASAAGIPTIVTPNAFTSHHDFTGAAKCFPHLGEVHLVDIEALHTKIFD
jgi:HAD superfamily hydrolase (TIGR01509 family)